MSKWRVGAGARAGTVLALLCVAWYTPAPAQTACCRALNEPAAAVKDPSHVVLVAITRAGKRLVAAGEHGVIIYSDDSGHTWHQASVPVDVTLTDVKFATPKEGWAVGHYGVVLHSADGGVTWQKQLDGDKYNALAMAAAKIAVADDDPSPGMPLAIRRAQHFLDNGPSIPFLTIWAPNTRDATIFGAYRMAVKTSNGGRTWTDGSLHVADPISHNLYDVASIGSDVCIAAEAGLVFCSSDQGQTFLEVGLTGAATLLGILPTGDGGMLVFGVAGYAYRSEDRGKSWMSVDMDARTNLTAGIVLKSGAIAVVDQAGSIHVSHDHAKTFDVLSERQPMSLYNLAQAPNGDVVVVGSGGTMTIPAGAFN